MVASREEAFATWLNPGRPAYIDRYAVPLEEAVGLVAGAGGVSVVAHPWGRSRVLTPDHLERLAGLGLAGIEVDHQDHPARSATSCAAWPTTSTWSPPAPATTTAWARSTTTSGCNTTPPEQLERLLQRAGDAAAASGRATPALLVP